MLWGAFAGLALLTASGVALTMTVLYMEQRLEYRVVQESGPFVDAVNTMLTDVVAWMNTPVTWSGGAAVATNG